ncbi:MAG: hypothetical protein AAGF87_10100 [Bacteroidota bacterium]
MSSQKIGLYLVLFIGLGLGLTGVFKITSASPDGEFGGLMPYYILAAIDFAIAAAVLIPKTRLLGVILAASYIGGIIAFSWLSKGESPITGIVMNTVLYVGAALHWPKLREGKV